MKQVQLYGRAGFVRVDESATYGATIGVNVFNSDGSLFVPSAAATPAEDGVAVTLWELVQKIPAKVKALENATGTTGLFAVTGSATGALRTITAGSGIDVTNGSGVAGNPTIAHADTSSVADLSSDNSNGVVIQDVTVTFDAFGHVLTATVGTVNLDSRYLQATSIGNGLKIAAGVLSAGESGTEDGTTVLAGDGIWRDYVTNNWGSGGAWLGPSFLYDANTGGLYAQRSGNTARFTAFSAGQPSQFIGGRTGGTLAAQTATPAVAGLFDLYGMSYTGSGYAFCALISFLTTEIHSATAQGTRMVFYTTATGSTALTGRAAVENDGTFNPLANATYDLGASALRWRNFYLGGAQLDTGVVSPAQLTANTDNWSITGLSTAKVIRFSTNAALNITGIASPSNGQRITLCNIGSFNATLSHDVTSTAANRFLCPNSAALVIRPNGAVDLWYDNTSSRWRVIGI